MNVFIVLGCVASLLGGWLIQPYLVRRPKPPEPQIIVKKVYRDDVGYFRKLDHDYIDRWVTPKGQAAFNRKLERYLWN